MTDQAHVATKSSQSLFESREIAVVRFDNPSADPVLNYRTSIDPALISSKPIPVDQCVLDLGDEAVPAWLSKYGTGRSESEIFYKSNLLGAGSQFVTIGDGPWVSDIGAIVDVLPPTDDVIPSLSDNWHKNVVTDLSACDTVIAASLQFPYLPFFSFGLYQSQMILFPVSSRHIVKTPNGHLHAVTAYVISSLSRIVHFVSTNGGETWTATVVDNNDGHHYVLPSITCDRNGGIHITYTRWDQVVSPTYWLFAGGSTPTGFELVSGAGGLGYHRLLGGGDSSTYPALGVDPDTYNTHRNSYSVSGGLSSPNASAIGPDPTPVVDLAYSGWHHTTADISESYETILPLSRSLKLLRFNGIPTVLPADIVVPFDADVSAGFTRYSAHDGYHIYCSDDVGTVVGAAQHRHLFTTSLSGTTAGFSNYRRAGSVEIQKLHSHTGSTYTAYANNSPPSYRTVLGLVSADRTTLPVHSLLMYGLSSIARCTCLSDVGDALKDKYLVGGASYADLGGDLEHDHTDFDIVTGAAVGTGNDDTGTAYTVAAYNHVHTIAVYMQPYSNVQSRVLPYIHHVDTELNLSTYGNDLFYVYISPEGTPTTPLNVSQIKLYFPSFEGICLADGSDNVHFLWSAQGLNTTPSNARISYKKLTGYTLSARTDLTTSDEHMLYPSMDIDIVGDIHTAWFNYTTLAAVQYRKYTSGAWAAVETIDNSSYVGIPSNIITDRDCNVFLAYAKWTDAGTAIKEVLYRKRTSGGWSAAVNLSPGKEAAGYNQFPGQCYLDNKGNVIFTWSGKGYGSHTGVYHPVYRYVTPDGTVVPSVVSDAVDMFPDDDLEIYYPTVFWHAFPLTDQVYQNLVVSGLTFAYLYNPRNGATKDTADLKFYSSKDALVGDSGPIGSGGSGDGEFSPGGVSGESLLQKDIISITQRGYICRTNMNPSLMGNYML